MKKIVSLILVALIISLMMSVATVPAFAVHSSRNPQEEYDVTISPQITPEEDVGEKTLRGATINEMNPTTYIVVAIGIFVVAIGLGILIGYNVKKKKIKKES